MSNRFSALLLEEDEEARPIEVVVDTPAPDPLIGTIIAPAMVMTEGDEAGWEKAEGRKHSKKVLKSKTAVVDPIAEAFGKHKKLHAACMREFAVQVELRTLYQTLVQEWCSKSYDHYSHLPKRNPCFSNLLKHKFTTTTGFNATVGANVVRVDGCCCESWDYYQDGWTIVVPTQVAKIPELAVAVRTHFLPELPGWYSTTVKSAAMRMEPVSLTGSGEVVMLFDLKFETKKTTARTRSSGAPGDYWRTVYCSCDQPRGCGRMDCDCLRCIAQRYVVDKERDHMPCDDTTNDYKICMMALEVIRRFFTRIRPARAGAGA